MKRSLKVAIAGAILSLLVYLFSPGSIAWLVNSIHTYWMGIIGTVGFAFFGAGLTMLFTARSDEESKEAKRFLLGGFIVTMCAFFAQIYVRPFVNLNYIRAFSANVVEETSDTPGYEIRPIPYDIAYQTLRNATGSYPGTSLTNLTYVVQEGVGAWTAIANGDDFIGLRSSKGIVVLNNDGTIEQCGADMPALGGSLLNSLTNRIRDQYLFASIVWEDAYGLCNEYGWGTVYVPLRKLVFPFARPQPAGVAVISGLGAVEIVEQYDLASLPGPSYPASIVELQELSINTARGFWSFVIKQSGFQVVADESDPNYENPGQFLLVPEGNVRGNPQYVSLHVPQGDNRGIALISSVSAKQLPSLPYNLIRFVRYTETLDGSQQVADDIRPYLPAELLAVLDITEVVPGPQDTRIAYVGAKTKVWFIVTVDNNSGEISVQRVAETSVTDLQSSDLETLTKEEFEFVFRRVLREFYRRTE